MLPVAAIVVALIPLPVFVLIPIVGTVVVAILLVDGMVAVIDLN